MTNYQALKNKAANLKHCKAETSNYLTLSSIADDYEELVNDLLTLVEKQLVDITQLERLASGKSKRYD